MFSQLQKTQKQAYTSPAKKAGCLFLALTLPLPQNSSMRQLICFLCLFIHRRQSQLPHPPKPQYGCRLYLVPHSISFFLLGVCRCLCLARLLNRSGCRFVTFFVSYAESRFFHFSLLDPLSLEPYATIQSAAFRNTQQESFVPQTLAYPFAPCSFVFPLLSKPSTASATHTSRLSFLLVPRQKFKPLVYPIQFHRQQKNAPNLCAKGIGRSLAFLSSAISTSTFAQLADGSRTSLSTFRYLSISFVPFTSQTPVAPP